MDNLKIGSIFKDKAKEGEDSVIDTIMQVLQLLRRDLRELVDTMELVELWDEG